MAHVAIYTLQSLGVGKRYIYNCMCKSTQVLADVFPNAHIELLDSIDVWPSRIVPPNFIILTVPSDATTIAATPSNSPSTSSLLPNLFLYCDGPAVVINMVYKPTVTSLLLLALAQKAGEN